MDKNRKQRKRYLIQVNEEEENILFSIIRKPKREFSFRSIDFRKLFKSYTFKVLISALKSILIELQKRMIKMELLDENNINHFVNQIFSCIEVIEEKYNKIEGKSYIPVLKNK